MTSSSLFLADIIAILPKNAFIFNNIDEKHVIHFMDLSLVFFFSSFQLSLIEV